MSKSFRLAWTDDTASFVETASSLKGACDLIEHIVRRKGLGSLCEAKFIEGKIAFTYYSYNKRIVFIVEEVLN